MFVREVKFNFKNIEKDSYLNSLIFKDLTFLKFSKNIIFLTGQNGVGKTTFMESIAYDFNLNKYGGSKNFILDEDNKPELYNFIDVLKLLNRPRDAFFFRSDTFFNLEDDLKRYNSPGYDYSGDRSFKEQSHGESFMSFFQNRIGDNGIYFFDEPETALAYENQILFLFMLREFEKLNNQIFIITHSPILLSYPNAEIFNFSLDGVEKLEYEQTDQYNNYKDFLDNYQRFQKEIMDDKII